MTCPDAESLAAGDPEIAAHLAECSACARIAAAIATDDDSVPEPQATTDEPALGEALGRYILVAHLGSGGMGVVAAAYDPQLDRNVALKWIRADKATPAFARRFEREAQTLARLVHPHVVRVYDAGIANGRPFLAMELVAGGLTLRAYLASEERSTADIVRIFTEVARGLAAVHEAGWVHRDVKPDNILVDRTGTARLADFGLASAIENAPTGSAREQPSGASSEQLSGSTSEQPSGSSSEQPSGSSRFAAAGTPAYMSPEHLRGDDVDARSDQWSWGAALAEAMRGRAVPKRVRDVIARATAEDPAARFADMTAAARALAAPRVRFWPLATLGAVVLSGAITAVVVSRSPSEIDSCATAGAALARDWDTTESAVLAGFAATGHPAWRARLDATAHTARAIATQWGDATTAVCRARGTATPEAACLAQQRDVARALFVELAHADRALVDQAPIAITRLPRAPLCRDANVVERVRAASAIEAPLATRLASLQARASLRKPAAIVDELTVLAADARAAGATQIEAEAKLLLGEMHSRLRDDARARDILEDAAQAAARARDDRVAALARLLQAGQAALLTTQREQAETLANVAQAAVERAGSPVELRAQLENILGAVAWARGDYAAALAHYNATIVARTEAFGADDPRVAAAHQNAGQAMSKLGKKDDARAAHETALAILERALGVDHPDLANTISSLGMLAADDERFDDAQRYLERARDLRVASLGFDHPEVATSENNLGKLAKLRGDLPAARAHFERSLAIQTAKLGPDAVELALPLSGLGAVLADMELWKDARPHLERAIAINEARRGKDHPALISMLFTLANVRGHLGDHDAERAILQRARTIAKTKLGPDHPQTKDADARIEALVAP
ncbi:MAG: tetratricopeptide repeat protein [Kofleriaceae bacterium]